MLFLGPILFSTKLDGIIGTAQAATSNPSALKYPSYNFIIDKNEYHHSIVPKLETLVTNFLSSWKEINPHYEQIVTVYQNIVSLKKKLIYARSRTLTTKDPLRVDTATVLNLLQNISFEILSLEQNSIDSLLNRGSSNGVANIYDPLIDLDSFINSAAEIDRLNNLITFTVHLLTIHPLDEANLHEASGSTSVNNNAINIHTQIIELTHQMEILSEEILFKSLPFSIREDYLLVWNEFFRIINNYILPFGNYHLFLKNINQFNFIWNNFYLIITKEKIPISNVAPYFRRIDDEWNMIIRELVDKTRSMRPSMPNSRPSRRILWN